MARSRRPQNAKGDDSSRPRRPRLGQAPPKSSAIAQQNAGGYRRASRLPTPFTPRGAVKTSAAHEMFMNALWTLTTALNITKPMEAGNKALRLPIGRAKTTCVIVHADPTKGVPHPS